ncbi:hypothetical protein SAMN02910358_01238 [Lachnospiraceae bacterium XBB1006]|nr:hypothetical protein SAMN02910358_01238 [Lachnospiraceae bacterium XBB1006]
MFIGREAELGVLESTYQKTGFQMTVIYGRRRIGKSTLIRKFLEGKRGTYYMANQMSLEANVRAWSAQFVEDVTPELEGVIFDNLDLFFQFMGKHCSDEKIVVALDDIPYIAEADTSFLSTFQRGIDTILAKKNIYLILCGSAVSFMEKEILSEKSPLFGRRSNQIFLKPFAYWDAAKFVPRYSYEEKAIVYGVTGGVAKYLTVFDDSQSLEDNLVNQFFSPSGYLYEETTNLLNQEFRNIVMYNMVIDVCANGASRANEIANKAHMSSASLTYILKNLMMVGVISKMEPITDEKNRKKCIYEITDGMYKFWYQFVPSGRAAIEMGRGTVYYEKNVKPRLHQYMGHIFEKMCQDYILLRGLDGGLPCVPNQVGSWWGNDHNRKQADIDVVAIDTMSNKAILGECKFTNSPVGKEVIDTFLSRKGLINHRYEEVMHVIFSVSGYTTWVQENAAGLGIELLGIKDLYEALRT